MGTRGEGRPADGMEGGEGGMDSGCGSGSGSIQDSRWPAGRHSGALYQAGRPILLTTSLLRERGAAGRPVCHDVAVPRRNAVLCGSPRPIDPKIRLMTNTHNLWEKRLGLPAGMRTRMCMRKTNAKHNPK